GEADLDALGDPGHGADRDRHLFAAPQVPLPQQHMRHEMAVRVDDQPFDLADVAVGGVNVLAALYLHLARRDRIVGHQVAPRAAVAVVGPGGNVGGAVVRGVRDAGDELPLPDGVEAVELRRGTPQPDLAGGGVDQSQRDEPGGSVPPPRLHDEMCDQVGDRVEGHPEQRAAGPVCAADVGSDREPFHFWHGTLLGLETARALFMTGRYSRAGPVAPAAPG